MTDCTLLLELQGTQNPTQPGKKGSKVSQIDLAHINSFYHTEKTALMYGEKTNVRESTVTTKTAGVLEPTFLIQKCWLTPLCSSVWNIFKHNSSYLQTFPHLLLPPSPLTGPCFLCLSLPKRWPLGTVSFSSSQAKRSLTLILWKLYPLKVSISGFLKVM